jgi:predicted dehydrogenase
MPRNGRVTVCCALACGFALLPSAAWAQPTGKAREGQLRIAIAGLVHGHVSGFLKAVQDRPDVEIVGVFEPDAAVRRQVGERAGLQTPILYSDLESMLDRTRPQIVAAFTSTIDHPMVVEACARRHIHVMMEKPLAVSMDHARRIREAALGGSIHVIVNYETTWYRSHDAIWKLVKEQQVAGEIARWWPWTVIPARRKSGSVPSSWPG